MGFDQLARLLNLSAFAWLQQMHILGSRASTNNIFKLRRFAAWLGLSIRQS